MIKPDSDKMIIRFLSGVGFFITAILLLYSEYYNLFVFYTMFGITLVSAERGELDLYSEHDMVRQFEHY
jgi:hypothetical protein